MSNRITKARDALKKAEASVAAAKIELKEALIEAFPFPVGTVVRVKAGRRSLQDAVCRISSLSMRYSQLSIFVQKQLKDGKFGTAEHELFLMGDDPRAVFGLVEGAAP